jgi:hypothetical protein
MVSNEDKVVPVEKERRAPTGARLEVEDRATRDVLLQELSPSGEPLKDIFRAPTPEVIAHGIALRYQVNEVEFGHDTG